VAPIGHEREALKQFGLGLFKGNLAAITKAVLRHLMEQMQAGSRKEGYLISSGQEGFQLIGGLLKRPFRRGIHLLFLGEFDQLG
jgi:hypothetical protein